VPGDDRGPGLRVSSAAGLSLTLAASDGHGVSDCTRGAADRVGGGPTLFSTTLAGTFCIPSSGNPLVDNAENLAGRGAVSVPGTIGVCLGLLCP